MGRLKTGLEPEREKAFSFRVLPRLAVTSRLGSWISGDGPTWVFVIAVLAASLPPGATAVRRTMRAEPVDDGDGGPPPALSGPGDDL